MSKIRYPLHGTLAILALLASSPVSSEAIREIEEASAEAREVWLHRPGSRRQEVWQARPALKQP